MCRTTRPGEVRGDLRSLFGPRNPQKARKRQALLEPRKVGLQDRPLGGEVVDEVEPRLQRCHSGHPIRQRP